MSRSPYKILIKPVMTERALAATTQQPAKYTFEVVPDANKREIRTAIEQIYNVKVSAVNTINRRGKAGRFGFARMGRRTDTRHAVITLKPGQPPIELA